MSNGNITRRGKRSWRIKYDLPRSPDGKRRTVVYTVKGARSDAEKELRDRLHKLDHGIAVDPSKVTVSEYVEQWLTDIAPLRVAPKALERYRGLAKNQITPHIGHLAVQKLRPADVQSWYGKLVASGISARTIRNARGVLRTALGHAATVEIVARNVAALVKPPSVARDGIEILMAEQISEALAKVKNLSIYTIAAVAIGTGARRGEIAAFRWSDIDLDAATVRIERALEQTKGLIRVKQPKTRAGIRTVSLPAFAVAALREHRKEQLERRIAIGAGRLPDTAPVFGTIEGDWPTPFSISDRWRDAV